MQERLKSRVLLGMLWEHLVLQSAVDSRGLPHRLPTVRAVDLYWNKAYRVYRVYYRA